MSAHPPIIIIGMSRSGTGMLAKMLEDLGLFIGKSKDRNNEALFFYRSKYVATRTVKRRFRKP